MFNTILYENLYWSFYFGRPKHKASIYDLRETNFKELPAPIFFLSTGRTGTKWFTHLMSKNKDVRVLHYPTPDLALQNKFVYKLENTDMDPNLRNELIKELFIVSREPYLRYSYKSEKTIIETNNHITFFAPVLYQLFPHAKFVHIYRHPGEIVRSGFSRKWYADNNEMTQKLITPPLKNEEWENYSQLKKIAWLWSETNSFIEKFHANNPDANFISFNFNNLSQKSVVELFDFLDINISEKKIEKALRVKVNAQKHGSLDEYNNWDTKQKEELISICGQLASKYNYQL